jgi:hypothetical protein
MSLVHKWNMSKLSFVISTIYRKSSQKLPIEPDAWTRVVGDTSGSRWFVNTNPEHEAQNNSQKEAIWRYW